jgi:hypothetical protein
MLAVVAIVEDDLEEPALAVIMDGTDPIDAWPPGLPVAVVDVLEVPVRRPGPRGAVPFVVLRATGRDSRCDPGV